MKFDNFNLEGYRKTIGSGGFGLIVKHISKNKVIKLIYKSEESKCSDINVEFIFHTNIYKAFNNYLKNNLDTQIDMPEPLSFSNKHVKFNDMSFSCFYAMTYLQPIENEYLHHIIIKPEYQKFDRVLGRNYNKSPSETNPARGFFASISTLSKLLEKVEKDKSSLKTVNDIVFNMGLLYAIQIFGAEYTPKDVEYVLSKNKDNKICVSILDFGMVFKIRFGYNYLSPKLRIKTLDHFADELIDVIQDMDLYFPYSDDKEYYKDFIKGFSKGAIFFIENEKNEKKQKDKKYILERYIERNQ